MKILITGSSGFLGRIIEKQCRDAGHEVFTLSRNLTSSFNCDLTHNVPVFDQRFDIVVHAAGKAHLVPKTEAEKNDFFLVNSIGTKHLLEGLSAKSPTKLVFISTVSVYGAATGENISELLPLNAIDAYGRSKIDAEKEVQKWCNEKKVNYLILRLPLIIADNAPGNLGAMIKGIKMGTYFNIVGGKAKKSMVLATDVANLILQNWCKSGIYNLTDGYHPSFKELSVQIAKQLNKRYPRSIPLSLAVLLAKIGNFLGYKFPINEKKLSKIMSTLTFDDSKAKNELGWDPTPVLKGFKISNQ